MRAAAWVLNLLSESFTILPPLKAVLLLYLGPNSVSFILFQTILPKVKWEVLNKGTYHSLS